MTPEALKAAIREALLEARQADVSEHAEHHEFIKELIEERRERKEMYAALKLHLLKGGLWGLVVFLAAAVSYWVRHHI